MRAINSPLGQHPKTPRVFGVADRRIQAAADYFHSLLARTPAGRSIAAGAQDSGSAPAHQWSDGEMRTLASTENPLCCQPSMSVAASRLRNPFRHNHRSNCHPPLRACKSLRYPKSRSLRHPGRRSRSRSRWDANPLLKRRASLGATCEPERANKTQINGARCCRQGGCSGMEGNRPIRRGKNQGGNRIGGRIVVAERLSCVSGSLVR